MTNYQHDTNDLMQSIINATDDLIFVKDTDFVYLAGNRAFEEFIGRSLNEIIGHTDDDLFPDKKSVDHFRDWDQKLFLSCKTQDIEEWVNYPDGRKKLLHTIKYPIYENNDIIGLVGVSRDITAHRKVNEFNQKTAEILEMIARGSPTVEIYNAIALLYESRHPGLRCSMLELSEGKLLHGAAPSLPREYCRAVHGLPNGPDVGSCGTATYTGKRCVVENIETDPKWKDIKEIALPHGMRSCWSEPIKDSAGGVLGAFGMYYNYPALPNEEESEDLKSAARLAGIVMERDHSKNELNKHRKKLEELVAERTIELEGAKKEAEQANRAKSQFLANMSHEIRTPMNSVMGMTHLALQSELNDKQKNYISKAHNSADNLLRILNDILDFSKIEAGKLEFEAVEFDLKTTMDAAISLIKFKADENNIRFSTLIDHNVPTQLIGDPMRLHQVLVNLGGNAIKFCNGGDRITLQITIQEENEYETVLRFSIQDTGIGISPKQQKKLFQEFVQADSSTTREYGGTGLGLVISKNIVQMMGGKIWVESEINVGSTFYFTAYLKKIQNNDSQVEGSNSDDENDIDKAIAKLREAEILLVEDNDLNQEFIQELFLMEGIAIEIASNGKEALELLSKRTFDIVLMDCQMPIMDGYEATRVIRQQKSAKVLPVIALTGNAMKGHLEEVQAIGMNDQISKPIDPDIMFETMAKYLYSTPVNN